MGASDAFCLDYVELLILLPAVQCDELAMSAPAAT